LTRPLLIPEKSFTAVKLGLNQFLHITD
jgi:hypothetical protein